MKGSNQSFDDVLYRLSRSAAARAILTPALRAYLRYFPGRAGKETLWNRVVNPYLAWHSHRFVARSIFGRRFGGDTKDMIQQYLYYFGVWEAGLTAWISEQLRPGDTFVDVGANIGYYSLLASTLVAGSGSVVAIEASPTIYRQLQANLARNRAANVRSVNVAAAERPGKLPLFRGLEHNLGETSLFHGPGFEPDGMVEAAPLESLLDAKEKAKARLIKVDIEGAEGAVLPGLVPWLSSSRSDLELLVEFHPQYLTEPGRRADDLVRLLGTEGFQPYTIENDYWPLRPSTHRPTALTGPIRGETMVVFSRRKGPIL